MPLPEPSGIAWSPSQAVLEAAGIAAYNVPAGAEVDTICAVVLAAAFPLMLREFLWGDDARDVTGSWGFTSTQGDELREQLMALVEGEG